MAEILEIKVSPMFDESIANYEIHSHLPYATTSYGNNDEIHIAIQHQDHCLLPSKSFIHIQGKVLYIYEIRQVTLIFFYH